MQIKVKYSEAYEIANRSGKDKQRFVPKGEADKEHAVRIFAKTESLEEKAKYWFKGLFRKTVWVQTASKTFCKASQSSLVTRYGKTILSKKDDQGVISKDVIQKYLTRFKDERKQMGTYLVNIYNAKDKDSILNHLNILLDHLDAITDPVLKTQFKKENYLDDEPTHSKKASNPFLMFKNRLETEFEQMGVDQQKVFLKEIGSHTFTVGVRLKFTNRFMANAFLKV